MKHITLKTEEKLYQSRTLDFYFKGMRIGVLDIETTGLNPAVNHFILGGLYSVPEGTLHQFFAETRAEEEEALSGYLDILRDLVWSSPTTDVISTCLLWKNAGDDIPEHLPPCHIIWISTLCSTDTLPQTVRA